MGGTTRRLEDVASLARFQFGGAGAALLAGASLRGRWPFLRILRDGVQLGAVADRGLIALTLAGADVLREEGVFCVEIEDFYPKGNLFAVGVERASPEIRVGSEVAVVHGDEVRAVGVARMNGREMVDFRRGEAVRVRHRVPTPAAGG